MSSRVSGSSQSESRALAFFLYAQLSGIRQMLHDSLTIQDRDMGVPKAYIGKQVMLSREEGS
jgi:hypothetical protein